MSWSEKRSLGTGGPGFTGSRFYDHRVALCIDDSYLGRRQNIARLLMKSRLNVVRPDAPPYVVANYIYRVQSSKTNGRGAISALGMVKRIKAKIYSALTIDCFKSINQPSRSHATVRCHPRL